MKILLITYNLGRTASGIVSERVLTGLLAKGHDVRVITSENDSLAAGSYIHEIRSNLQLGSVLYRIWTYRILPLFTKDPFNSNYFWRWRALRCARKMFKTWKPDCIYCRTSPIDSCFVGMKLKQRYNFPLAVNLTDPLPAPIEYVPNGPLRDKLISSARTIISQSDIVMMGTEKAIEYECSIVGSLHRCKFRVSPDPVPSSKISILPHNNQSTTNLVYLGSIYGSRNILPLVEAMEMLRNEGVNISLTICSDPQKDAIRRDFIHYIGWVSDIMKILSNADILVDIDGDDSKPVFISSKLKQYLTINRPILSITPSGSPAAELLNGMETVYVCNNSVDLILENLKNMTSQSFVIDNYAERSMLLREFSIETVTTDLLRALEEICI